jgi:hypothetical protein
LLILILFVFEYVRDVGHGPIADRSKGRERAARPSRKQPPEPVDARSICMHGGQMNPLTIEACDVADIGAAQLDGAVHDRLEDRLNVRSGSADDL